MANIKYSYIHCLGDKQKKEERIIEISLGSLMELAGVLSLYHRWLLSQHFSSVMGISVITVTNKKIGMKFGSNVLSVIATPCTNLHGNGFCSEIIHSI